MMLSSLLRKFEANQVFTEAEGWALFRLAAIAEAFGWSLLIVGIFIRSYVLPGNQIPVELAGHIHGILFLLYALAATGLYPTLKWSHRKAFIALLASIPPYGSLLFEMWAQHLRHTAEFKTYGRCVVMLAMLVEYSE